MNFYIAQILKTMIGSPSSLHTLCQFPDIPSIWSARWIGEHATQGKGIFRVIESGTRKVEFESDKNS